MSALAQRVARSIQDDFGSRNLDRVGPFSVQIDRTSANVWRNYAVPDIGAAPTAADVAALIEFFQSRGRTPRLEYVPSAAPDVEPMLIAAGFLAEGRPPLMACRRGQLTATPVVDGIDIRLVDTPEDLFDAARAQDQAYGSTEPTGPDDVARLQNTIRRGGSVVLARDSTTGAPVGGGLVSGAVDGVGELAAVGVVESHRRRGIATAVTAALTIVALENGAEIVWLEPAGEREAEIYRRAGFVSDGEKLWISLPGRDAVAKPVDFDHAAQRLTLELVSPSTAEALLDGDLSGVTKGDGWPHENTMAGVWMAVHQGAQLWFAIVDGLVIGEGGTFGPPDADGAIEIGYGLAKPYEGRGYEAELAAAITELLLARPDVSRVVDTMMAASPDVGPPDVDGSEAETLTAFIAYLRASIVAKVSGLSEDDARKPLVGSGTNLLGLLKHVVHIEVFWLHQVFAGISADAMPSDKLTDSDSIESLTAAYREIASVSDAIVAATPDITTRAKQAEFREAPTTLRWILIHLVEEIGRHAGHADIIREQIDGAVGR